MLGSILGAVCSDSEDKPFRIATNATSKTKPAANAPNTLFFWFVGGTDGEAVNSGINKQSEAYKPVTCVTNPYSSLEVFDNALAA
ncbi:MAG: hypothetical protein K0S58_860 [Nitrospira sp.]|jgi:hypothetical protein|nr:hypothetical protein [Nitrospira sp.]